MSYAGDVSAKACWEALQSDEKSQLVDVRTVPEWQFVGLPQLGGLHKSVICVEWQSYPAMSVSQSFVEVVAGRLAETGSSQSDQVFMLCRSGVRSIAAAIALTEAGYSSVYNVVGGFEGDHDANGHRSNIAGWKFEGLPWKQ